MPSIVDALVIEQEKIAPMHYRLHLSAPDIAAEAAPGQFLHVACSPTLDPLLRRPFSIHEVQREQGTVTLFYRMAGRGTALLASQKAGSGINTVGPLGRGFTMPSSGQPVVLVSGGMGIAPLLFLARELTSIHCSAQVFIGATSAKLVFFAEEIRQGGHQVHIATDDGSAGYRGTVNALLARHLSTLSPDLPAQLKLFACGPDGMLRHLSGIINESGISGEISLEERMGCGVGACLSCVCKTKDGADGWQYRRTCVDGPVFPAAEVEWE